MQPAEVGATWADVYYEADFTFVLRRGPAGWEKHNLGTPVNALRKNPTLGFCALGPYEMKVQQKGGRWRTRSMAEPDGEPIRLIDVVESEQMFAAARDGVGTLIRKGRTLVWHPFQAKPKAAMRCV